MQTETLANVGSMVINIAGMTVVGDNPAEFVQNSNCGSTLTAGANCTVNVTFIPTQAGPRSASIRITDDTGGSPQSVALDGVGLTSGPNATLSAQSMSFNSQTNAIQSLILTNYGTASLNVSGISTTTNFSESNTCIPSVASGANCTISVIFAPGTTGNFSGTLSITDDAPDGVQSVSLAGTGATGNTTLSGRCVGGLVNAGGCESGSAQDLKECPSGQPAITPITETLGCVGGFALVDLSRKCQATQPDGAIVRGHCEAH